MTLSWRAKMTRVSPPFTYAAGRLDFKHYHRLHFPALMCPYRDFAVRRLCRRQKRTGFDLQADHAVIDAVDMERLRDFDADG
jgi:hypothetical protein